MFSYYSLLKCFYFISYKTNIIFWRFIIVSAVTSKNKGKLSIREQYKLLFLIVLLAKSKKGGRVRLTFDTVGTGSVI